MRAGSPRDCKCHIEMEIRVFEAKVYEYSTPFRGDPDAALTLAKAALLAQGFEILPGSSAELRAKGPGMRSTQQSALLGVSCRTAQYQNHRKR